MVTKTLTITEEAYNLLARHKLEGESFSQEITRLLASRPHKRLMDFFGILGDEGQGMQEALQHIRKKQTQFAKERLRRFE